MVFTKFFPYRPHTQEVRTTVSAGPRADSPASFERPYTDIGLVASHSWYPRSLRPSKT